MINLRPDVNKAINELIPIQKMPDNATRSQLKFKRNILHYELSFRRALCRFQITAQQ